MRVKLNNFIQIYKQLKDSLKWKISDNKILMTISSMYITNEKVFNLNTFLDLAEEIKSQSGFFSPLRSHLRFTTAAMLDVKFANPTGKIPELFDVYDAFRKSKFASGIYTYISAYILLANEQKDKDRIITRTKEIYDGMSREHMFLTSSNDYPLATLLALDNRPDVINHIESFYEELSKNGFRKGNDLQFLSHILALGKDLKK